MFKEKSKDLPYLLAFALTTLFIIPITVYAVPPPDFLFNVGGQIIQAFSIAALFLGAIFSVAYKYIKTKLALLKGKKVIFILGSVVAIIAVSIGAGYLYGEFVKQQEYDKWIEESESYADLNKQSEDYYTEKISRGGTTSETYDLEELREKGDLDQFAFNVAPKIPRGQTASSLDDSEPEEEAPEQLRFISSIDEDIKDENTDFIEDYYEAIATQDFDTAYALSKQSTNFDTFKSWYINTTGITIDKLTRIDRESSSLELTLFEGEKYTRYGTSIKLRYEGDQPVQIASSNVRVLAEGVLKLAEKGDEYIAEKGEVTNDYYTQNQNYPDSIDNSEFSYLLNSNQTDYIVLDAREDLEYENGYLPGSLHIRYADLQAGKWIDLPEDKRIIVICWSGIRGKEVSDFLRTKNLVAAYLLNGANGWVEWGGLWEGNIKFSQRYTEARYTKKYDTSQVKDLVEDGVFLVDSREPWLYDNWHISGSVNIPIMHTPTNDLEDAFNQVPPNSTFITICDGYVNCFDAKITAVELEERGHTFLGRYPKPWEYE